MSDLIHICDEDGCTSTETTQYIYPFGDDSTWLCDDHVIDSGFCYGCHHFFAGLESFDFSPVKGLCSECLDDLRYETGEYDDDDVGWDFYAHSWYDPDVPSDMEDSQGTYIGPDREDLG